MTKAVTTGSFLLASVVLFFWMFLSSDGLDQLAAAGGILALTDEDARDVGHVFAARWRHGMAGGWPLYMPGFFATATAIWFWCRDRRLVRLIFEGIGVMFIAALIAGILAPVGSRFVIAAFTAETGLRPTGVPSAPSAAALGLGFLTLISWSSFIIAGQRAIVNRRLEPFLAPAAFAVLLALARPVTLGDAFAIWGRRTLSGEPAALFSSLLIPVLAFILVRQAHPPVVKKRPQSAERDPLLRI